MRTRTHSAALVAALLGLPASSATIQAQDVRPGASSQQLTQELTQQLSQKKRAGLKDTAASFWIYDDVAAGYAMAKTSQKPLLVSFRCVP